MIRKRGTSLIAVLAVLVVCVVAATAIARADPFDPTTGTVAVMASGGTVYEDYAAGPQSVNGSVTVATVTLPANTRNFRFGLVL
ncbi:hypothetical protein [Parafrankia sp. FMc2]|uniref:hypothetical protein n=1 Tax=Parafrankia sp. FMc2 TaxID=3233196 RepID=UPI0034D3EA57